MYLCVFLYFLHAEYQNRHAASKLGTFLGGEDIFAGPHKLGLSAGSDVVLRLTLELGFG